MIITEGGRFGASRALLERACQPPLESPPPRQPRDSAPGSPSLLTLPPGHPHHSPTLAALNITSKRKALHSASPRKQWPITEVIIRLSQGSPGAHPPLGQSAAVPPALGFVVQPCAATTAGHPALMPLDATPWRTSAVFKVTNSTTNRRGPDTDAKGHHHFLAVI